MCVHRPGEGDLEGLVASDEGGQPGQTLLPGPPHPHQQGVPLGGPQDAGDLDQVGDRILGKRIRNRKRWWGLPGLSQIDK